MLNDFNRHYKVFLQLVNMAFWTKPIELQFFIQYLIFKIVCSIFSKFHWVPFIEMFWQMAMKLY